MAASMPEEAQLASTYRLMILTAWADGRFVADEALVTDALLSRMPDLQRVAEKNRLAAQAKARLDEIGLVPALTEAAQDLRDRAERERAFVCCARVLEADGHIALEEFRVLRTLQQLFSLSEAAMARLLAEAAR